MVRFKRRTYGFYFQPLVFPSDLLRSLTKMRNCALLFSKDLRLGG